MLVAVTAAVLGTCQDEFSSTALQLINRTEFEYYRDGEYGGGYAGGITPVLVDNVLTVEVDTGNEWTGGQSSMVPVGVTFDGRDASDAYGMEVKVKARFLNNSGISQRVWVSNLNDVMGADPPFEDNWNWSASNTGYDPACTTYLKDEVQAFAENNTTMFTFEANPGVYLRQS